MPLMNKGSGKLKGTVLYGCNPMTMVAAGPFEDKKIAFLNAGPRS